MKKSTVLIVLIFISTLLPQQTDEIKPSVKNFYTELNNIVAHYDKKLGMQKKFSNDELFNAAKLLYTVTEDDPVGFQKQLKAEFDAWGTETIKNHGKSIGIKPGTKLRILRKLINEKYGEDFANILMTPYYLKIKILDMQRTSFKVGKNPFPKIDLICSVEDVIKGEKKFKKEDVVTVSFLLNWFPNGSPHFEKGNSYFMPVGNWDVLSEGKEFAISIKHSDRISAILLLKENQLIDPQNCYSLDSTSNWEIFKSNFFKKYRLN